MLEGGIFCLMVLLIYITFVPGIFTFSGCVIRARGPIGGIISSSEGVIATGILMAVVGRGSAVLVSPGDRNGTLLVFRFGSRAVAIPMAMGGGEAIFGGGAKLRFMGVSPPPVLFRMSLPPEARNIGW